MTKQTLTEGARRALERAANLAENIAAWQVEPQHLLQSLVMEESNAAEILAEQGLTATAVDALCPLDETPADDHPQPGRREGVDGKPVPHSETLQQVIRKARQEAGFMGLYSEVGSEHLLFGLVTVDSPVRQLLRDNGLKLETITGRVTEDFSLSAEPLEVDFDLVLRQQSQQPETDQTDTFRVIDAAANRAREGLRVVEDFVRFSLDDAHLTGLLKSYRHDLTEALKNIDATVLLAARDTQQDVGTGISTPSETIRRSSRDVAQANFKRLQEAVRTLEEFGKIVSPELGESLGQLRYRFYTLEKAALQTHRSRERLNDHILYLLVTETLCHHGSEPAIRESLAAGVSIVQVREKSMSDRSLIEHAGRVRRWTREAGALLIMNDRADLAVLADADGVHVGQEELTVRQARRIVGPGRLVGVSTHSIEQARQAILDGADYLGVGPVFPSQTKQFDQYAGLELVRRVAAEIALPWFAIGGINADNIRQVHEAGATHVALSSAICGSEKPAETTRRLLESLCQR